MRAVLAVLASPACASSWCAWRMRPPYGLCHRAEPKRLDAAKARLDAAGEIPRPDASDEPFDTSEDGDGPQRDGKDDAKRSEARSAKKRKLNGR